MIHRIKLLDDEPVRWKAVERHEGEPCTAVPFLQGGAEWTPLVGAGRRRVAFRAFRLRVDDDGQPVRETLNPAPHLAYPLGVHWTDEDKIPEGVSELPGLPGWWLLHAEILAY